MPSKRKRRKNHNTHHSNREDSSDEEEEDYDYEEDEVDDRPSYCEEDLDVADALDDLNDNKSNSDREFRMSKYKTLSSAFKKNYLEPVIEKRNNDIISTITTSLKRSISQENGQELALVAELVEVLAISYGAEADEIFELWKKPLLTVTNDLATSPSFPCQAAQALGMLCFVGCGDTSGTIQIANHYYKLFTNDKNHPVTIATSISIWSLLITSIPQGTVVDEILYEAIPLLGELVEHKNLAVRANAGIALALLVEIHKANEIELSGVYEESYEYDIEALLPEFTKSMLNNLQTLAKGAYMKHIGKKNKTQQKNIFKEVYNSITQSDSPSRSIDLQQNVNSNNNSSSLSNSGNTQHFTFNGWTKSIQFDALKNALEFGFPAHMINNELLQQILEFEMRTTAAVASKRETKAHHAENKKNLKQGRAKDRANKQAATSHNWT